MASWGPLGNLTGPPVSKYLLKRTQFQRLVLPLDPVTAISVGLRPGFLRIAMDQAPRFLGNVSLAARWIIPNSFSDFLRHPRWDCHDGRSQPMSAVLTDMASWFARCGGNPQTVAAARDVFWCDSNQVDQAFQQLLLRLRMQGAFSVVHINPSQRFPQQAPSTVVGPGGPLIVRAGVLNARLKELNVPELPLETVRAYLFCTAGTNFQSYGEWRTSRSKINDASEIGAH